MKSKLAIWSFISIILIFVIYYLLSLIIPTLFISTAVNWVVSVFYLIPLSLGISALISIKKNKNLKGKGFAIAGIILISIFFLINILSLLISSR